MKKSLPLCTILFVTLGVFWGRAGSETLTSKSSRGAFSSPCPKAFEVQLLPGKKEFVFSMYGTPGDLKGIQQLVAFMQAKKLGNGFDPGPGTQPDAKPVFDYLASIGWPVTCYSGGEMQIKGGRAVLGPENARTLSSMDQAGVFSAVQLGEWGYYFHNLSPTESWWRDVYGKEFDAFKHLMKPKGLAGYDRFPSGKKECYEVVQDYFMSRSHDLLGRVISVTGHSHYEAYVGEWGASCIGLELGENIAFTQSKLAFARGASRQWRKPFSVQVSPWFSGSCTTSGALRREGNAARGFDAGHSLNFYERMWLHAWFCGAAMVTPENSISTFFESQEPPYSISAHGIKASEVFQFMKGHDRGVAYTPVAIVLDHYAGYNAYMDKPWGILKPTVGDREVRDLFDHQLFPGDDHIHGNPFPENPEFSYLRPTPFGEIFDVQLSNASEEMLSSYPVVLLAGDMEFDAAFVMKLKALLKHGSKVLISAEHKTALGEQFGALSKFSGLEVLEPWINPDTTRPAAISNVRLQRLCRETLPFDIQGDPVQYEVNRNDKGWVIELINNAGVIKKPDEPVKINPGAGVVVTIHSKVRCSSAMEWRTNLHFDKPKDVRIELGPGKMAYVELTARP